MRGEEQQLIDRYLIAEGKQHPSDSTSLLNSYRGVAVKNPVGCGYYLASVAAYGWIAPYTGNGHCP